MGYMNLVTACMKEVHLQRVSTSCILKLKEIAEAHSSYCTSVVDLTTILYTYPVISEAFEVVNPI